MQDFHPHIAHDLEEKPRTKDVILEENVSFSSLLLPDTILKGLTTSGFRKPAPIQFKAIPLGRCGFDLIIKSKSGTGKTLVFSIVALETINVAKNQLQVLILVPTREIAVQIQEVLRNVGSSIEGLRVESFIGGLPVEDDIKKTKQCHIAVGAPGRVKHLINLGALTTESVRLFVLDEADKLMETSFQSDINEIYNTLPQRKQVIASSATYPQELDLFLTNYMLSPTHVSSENETPVLLGLKQFVSIIKTNNLNIVQLMKAKNESLLNFFSKVSFTQCLVFSNYQNRAESISNYLNQKGWNSSFISAAQSQTKRLEAVNNLRDFKNRILLSTDLTSRGIDAPNVDLVINYDIPKDAVTYLHRMGRAGRYGSSGICINLAAEGDELKQLQNILGTLGASNLSVSILPNLSENVDLWKLDPNSLEKICGMTSSDALHKVSDEIKNEIMALKQIGQKNNKQNNSKKNKKNENVKLVELSDIQNIKSVFDKKEEKMEEVYEKFTNLNTEHLLQSLVSTDSTLENDDSKKRKRGSCGKEIRKEKRKNDTKHTVFCKNKALLSVTKLLCSLNVQIDSDMINSIQDYINILREDKSEDSNYNSWEEILNHDKSEETAVKVDERIVMEDILKIGYECAIGKTGKNWMEYLSKEELDEFHELCREEQIAVLDSEDDEQDCEMDDYQEESEVVEEGSDQNHDIALQWVPVVQNDSSNDPCDEHFIKCYDDCNDVLWQHGLTFETVEDFDNWFYQWQEQLLSVRNYVQQNIYVAEMSKYQQSKLTNK